MNTGYNNLIVTRWGARFQGQKFSCAIGRGGIGIKGGEGDGITPIGTFDLCHVYLRSDRVDLVNSAIDIRTIGAFDRWSDDPKDPAYNLPIQARHHPFSSEKLRRADPLYDVVGVLSYNYPNPVAGKGSAIFLHKWRKPRHPTEGCIAFDEADIMTILSRWTTRSRVVIKG